MSANTFGHILKVHSFGESHGPALGAVIEGCPSGLPFDLELLKSELERRRPGGSQGLTSGRQEADLPEILSGVFEGRTLGTPITILVRNQDARSEDYKKITNAPRAGHADDVWQEKFDHRDPRGGGRSSGRETVSRVMAGAIAKMLLRKLSPETRIRAFVSELGPHRLSESEKKNFLKSSQDSDQYKARFPSDQHEQVATELLALKEKGDSWGGVVELCVQGPPKSLGQPVFHKLKADLASALMGVGATSAIEIGHGLHNPSLTGSKFHSGTAGQEIYGGIRGGISTGEEIALRVHIKPTSSILDVAKQGRHDPAILIRAVPVFESMVALVLADHLLWRRLDQV